MIFLAVAFASGLSTFLLIKKSAAEQEKSLVEEASSWQTLIGALLGFLFLSVSFFLTQRANFETDQLRKLSDERAYLQILQRDLAQFHGQVSSRSELLNKGKAEFDLSRCIAMTQIYRSASMPSLTLEARFVDLVPEMDQSFNELTSAVIQARDEYWTAFTRLEPSDCAASPMDVRDYYAGLHQGTDALLESYATLIGDRLLELEN